MVAGKITDAITSGNFAVIKFSGIDGATQWTWTTPSGDAQTVSIDSKDNVIAGGATNSGFAVVKIDPKWRASLASGNVCCSLVLHFPSHWIRTTMFWPLVIRQQDFDRRKTIGQYRNDNVEPTNKW